MNHKKMSAARNAPFGTDVQPTCNVKIIGGKAVEIPIDSPPTSAKNGKNLPPVVHHSPYGTSPMQTQPNITCDEGTQDNLAKQQYERLRAIASKTSPPDNSNSHIHGTRTRSNSLPCTHRVLPPIPMSSRYPSSESTPPLSSGLASPNESLRLEKPKISMTMQLCDMLRSYDSYCFKDMYRSLTEFDHKLTGYVNQAQLNMIALRHGLPIPTTTMRLLFTSFAKGSNPDVVNYEKLLQYLARAQVGSPKAETMLHESVNRFIKEIRTLDSPDEQVSLDEKIAEFEAKLIKTQQRSHDTHKVNQQSSPMAGNTNQKPNPVKESYGNHGDNQQVQRKKKRRDSHGKSEIQPLKTIKKPLKVFSERDDAMLLMLIEQQVIQGKEESMNMEEIRESMSDLDKTRDGTISQKQFQEVCLKHRLPFQGSLLDKIIMRCDTGESRLSWVAFIEFLSKVQSLNSSQDPSESAMKSSKESDRPGTWPTSPRHKETSEVAEPSRPPWETRKPLGPVMRKCSPTSVERDVTRDDTPSPTQSEEIEDAQQRKQLNTLAKQHAARAQRKEKLDTGAEDEEVEPWFSRFMHLAQGLYSSDSTNTGYLPREEMVRLVNNYNLIYNLKIPGERITKVISSCMGDRGDVMIEPLLDSLRVRVR
ncbi:uncharacterized protein C1orf87 homolog [Anneissia japonica]|uniref:uncharacterized protein C1orf87 homolog n=1 Tax=Anneissia japonica TaxID=1529436 RepID=UPI001425AE73|nr:uncharacterized protein C1orf87 homolog [Anneissia japonica]